MAIVPLASCLLALSCAGPAHHAVDAGCALPVQCFLALIENLAKHMLMIKDASFDDIMRFLDEAERHGKDTPTAFDDGRSEMRTISVEARILKKMFLRLRD
jgi:hypothetical protein